MIGIVPDYEYQKFYAFTDWLPIIKKESRKTQSFYYAIAVMFNRLPHVCVDTKNKEKLDQ